MSDDHHTAPEVCNELMYCLDCNHWYYSDIMLGIGGLAWYPCTRFTAWLLHHRAYKSIVKQMREDKK